MHGFICHLSKKQLIYPNIDSFLLQSFGDNLVLKEALKNIFECDVAAKYIFICPDIDKFFFETYIKNNFTSDFFRLKANSVSILGIKDNDPAAISHTNVYYNPSLMNAKDMFGAWNIKCWNDICRNYALEKCLVFNLESFWYLKPNSYEYLFETINNFNFSIKGSFDDDILLGLDTQRAKKRLASIYKQKKDQWDVVKENFKLFSKTNNPKICDEIEKVRSENIELILESTHNLSDAINHKKISQNLFKNLLLKIQSFGFQFSLRHSFGIDALKKYINILNDWKNFNMGDLKENLCFKRPRIFKIKIDNEFNYDLNKINKILQLWKASQYFIFELDQCLNINEKIHKFIRQLRTLTESKIYVELSKFKDLSELKNLFDAGIDVLVFNVDGLVQNVKDDFSYFKLDALIQQILTVKNEYELKYLILKISKNQNGFDISSYLYERWKYIVDDVVIYPDTLSPKDRFLRNSLNVGCSKVPYEVILRSDLTLSLCTQIQESNINPLNEHEWYEEIPKAGKMEICSECIEKFRYPKKKELSIRSDDIQDRILSEIKLKCLKYADECISKLNYSEGLEFIEKVLKFDPSNKEAWDKINCIEDLLKDDKN